MRKDWGARASSPAAFGNAASGAALVCSDFPPKAQHSGGHSPASESCGCRGQPARRRLERSRRTAQYTRCPHCGLSRSHFSIAWFRLRTSGLGMGRGHSELGIGNPVFDLNPIPSALHALHKRGVTALAPLASVFNYPVSQCSFEANVMPRLLRFDPFMP